MERWTRLVLRHRWLVVGIWIAILLTGGALSTGLSKLLSNEFTTPGTDSDEVRTLFQQRFGQRDDGSFLVVFRVEDSADAATRARLAAALERGAGAVEGGRAQPLQTAGPTVVFGTIGSPLELTEAKQATPTRARGDRPASRSGDLRQRRRGDPGGPRSDLRGRPPEGRGDRPARSR